MFIVVKTGNSQTLDVTQISINKRMDKYIVVYSNYTAMGEQLHATTWMRLKDVC